MQSRQIHGSHSFTAPTIIFVNDVLTTAHVPVVEWLMQQKPDLLPKPSIDTPPASLSAHSEILMTVLTSLSAEPSRTHIVALGVGVVVAIHLLASHPALVATFTGISFSIPNTQDEGNAMLREWVERAELARKWGMRITADKAVARWMDPSLRATTEWENIRDMVKGISVEEMEASTPIIKQFAGTDTDDGKPFGSTGRLLLQSLDVVSLFIAGSNDFGTISEDMKVYPAIMRGDGRFVEIERSGRLPWWENGARQRFMTLLCDWIEGDIS